MKSKVLLAVAMAGLLLANGTAAQKQNDQALDSMSGFLTSWLKDGNSDMTMAYFSASDRALCLAPTYVLEYGAYDADVVGHERQTSRADLGAPCGDPGAGDHLELPPGVKFGYWRLLGVLWPDASRVDRNLDQLLKTDPELVDFLRATFKIDYIQDDPFLVFHAADRAVLDTLDPGFAPGGYGQLAEVLKPTKSRPVLTMIADFEYGSSRRIGPLVTFWDEEVSRTGEKAWRIQALGAFPGH